MAKLFILIFSLAVERAHHSTAKFVYDRSPAEGILTKNFLARFMKLPQINIFIQGTNTFLMLFCCFFCCTTTGKPHFLRRSPKQSRFVWVIELQTANGFDKRWWWGLIFHGID